MRIVSLIPSATEMLFKLGLGDDVVAVTHECDFPAQVAELPKVTRNALPTGLSSEEIDAAVKQRTVQGESIYELDTELLASIEPDLIVTQALCTVCAVSYEDVRALAEELDSHPRVVSLDPTTVGRMPSCSITAARSAVTPAMVLPSAGWSERPHPRQSSVTTRWSRTRSGRHDCQTRPLVPQPCTSSRAGPVPASS